MPDALPPPAEDFARRARRERWLVLLVCALISLLLHLSLVWLWPGYGGAGPKTARLRASFNSMPVAAAPQAQPARKTAPAGHSDAPVAEKRAQQASADSPSAESGGGRLSGYIPVELLTTRPRFLVDMSEYIPASLDASESGRIVLQMLIGADGAVDGIVVESSEFTPRGTRRFVQRLDALRLQPGLRDGQPVPARWRMEFNLAPE